MKPAPDHRKRVKHYDEPGQGHELTFSCYRRLKLLDNDHRCQHLATAIDRAVSGNGFSLLAFVFMPEHVHMIVFPEDPTARISALLSAIKRPSSFRIKRDLLSSNDPLLRKLTIRERPGKLAFRFWQEGSGYDRNVLNDNRLRTMVDYVHLNPVRRGLVDHPRDWKWSSWRVYAGESSITATGLPTVNVLM